MASSGFSRRLMISRSTVSGDAPGYGMLTYRFGGSTSGSWLTRNLVRAIRPTHMITMIRMIVGTGRRILKSDKNILFPLDGCDVRCRRQGRAGHLGKYALDLLAVLEAR